LEIKKLARASKPGVTNPKADGVGDAFAAADCNAFDTAIDAVIDDYVSQTDAGAQATAGAIVHAGLQTFNGGVSGIPLNYSFFIKLNGADAEAYNSIGVLTYGGAADVGAIDGADHDAVIQAVFDACTGGETVYIGSGTFSIGTEINDSGVNNITVKMAKGCKLDLTANVNVFNISSVSGWVCTFMTCMKAV
jgi:hypothetical protein